MKKLISLLLVTLLVSCGKGESKSTVYTEAEGQCKELVGSSVDFIDITGEDLYYYKVDIMTIAANCSYTLDITAKDQNNNKIDSCSTRGTVELTEDRVNFIMSSYICGKVAENDDEGLSLSCVKNNLQSCTIINWHYV